MRRRDWIIAATSVFVGVSASERKGWSQPPAQVVDAPWPAANDDSAPALANLVGHLEAAHGGYRLAPLATKADFFEWQLFRYHLTAYRQVYSQMILPESPGAAPQWWPDYDASTWQGSLLAALSLKYRVTKDRVTLARISELLQGLHFFQEVTAMPGLFARAVRQGAEGVELEKAKRYVAPDGMEYFYRDDPAKGGYNQIAAGYAAMMLYAYQDLPSDIQSLAQADLTAMVAHVVDHHYKLTKADGEQTPYGDMTPVFASVGVPFNAQVAYLVVAVGKAFAGGDQGAVDRIAREYERLRDRGHVYYERPLLNLVRPQQVGASPFVKGMNDRNHVVNAAFWGILLELELAKREEREPDRTFLFQLGQTMVFGMWKLREYRNGLCNIMWGGLLRDASLFETIVRHKENTTRGDVDKGLHNALEQLRRFRFDRFVYQGAEEVVSELQWADTHRPDAFYWKCDPFARWNTTGPRSNHIYCAVDYLYAYWLLRFFELETLDLWNDDERTVI